MESPNWDAKATGLAVRVVTAGNVPDTSVTAERPSAGKSRLVRAPNVHVLAAHPRVDSALVPTGPNDVSFGNVPIIDLRPFRELTASEVSTGNELYWSPIVVNGDRARLVPRIVLSEG